MTRVLNHGVEINNGVEIRRAGRSFDLSLIHI